MVTHEIETDYLVVGAGISGLSFVDELLDRSDTHITIVDRRDAPGGHWNDAYSFVKLHQPSTFYGVGSMELGDGRVDADGLNKGFLSLAEGRQIISYCHEVMRDRFLPSGRVSFRPMTVYEADGRLRDLVSGERTTVNVRRKRVDATFYTNSIPLTHQRTFELDPQVSCLPPNDLPRRAADYDHYTVLGAGKTGIDACLWLLAQGADPRHLRWVIPRDMWFVNRAKVQPLADRFVEVFSGLAELYEGIAAARSISDLIHFFEQKGYWLRLDQTIQPALFHGAIMSEREVAELQRIEDTVRLGRVRALTPSEIVLAQGRVPASRDTLYVDCTASALTSKANVPVFQGSRIVLQALRYPLIPLSAALTAFLETHFGSDEDKNRFATPVPWIDKVEDCVHALAIELANKLAHTGHPAIRAWIETSRLEGFAHLATQVRPDETEKLAVLGRLEAALPAAATNISRADKIPRWLR